MTLRLYLRPIIVYGLRLFVFRVFSTPLFMQKRKSIFYRPEWLILGIVCIAANLRAPITGVAPVIKSIQETYALSATQAGFLTASPLLIFAAFSLLAAPLARKIGTERALFIGLSLLLIGTIWRIQPSVWSLYLGNNLIAIGIPLGNVLVPSLIKRYFPGRVAFLTAIYSLTMGVSAAAISALAIPLSQYSSYGWRASLLSVGLMITVSWLVWLPQLKKGPRTNKGEQQAGQINLWRSKLAWQVTFFLGLNSLFYYIFVSWMPSLLMSQGFSASFAANMHGLMQLASAVSGLLILPIVRHFPDQRPAVIFATSFMFLGLFGLWQLPVWSLFWTLALGFGSGAIFVLSLSFLAMRVSTTAQAASLAGMAQFVGYLLAASGPSLMGAFYDAFGSWEPMLIFCMINAVIIFFFGLAAGRDRQIGREETTTTTQ